MRNRTLTFLAMSLGSFALASSTLADDITSGNSGIESVDEQKVEHKGYLSPGFNYSPDANIDEKGFGNVSVWRADIRGGYSMTTEQGELGFGGLYEFSQYDLSKVSSQDYNFNTLGSHVYWKSMLNDNWGYFLYGGLQLSADSDANLGDGFTGTGAGGVRYVHSKELSFGLGIAVSSQLEDDALLLPVIMVNWQINDRWNLRVLNGAKLSFDVTGEKKFFVDAGLKYQRREYRLDNSDQATNNGQASLIETMVVAEIGATYRFSAKAALRGFVGVSAGRELEIRQNDHKVGDQDVDSSPIVGVRAIFTF